MRRPAGSACEGEREDECREQGRTSGYWKAWGFGSMKQVRLYIYGVSFTARWDVPKPWTLHALVLVLLHALLQAKGTAGERRSQRRGLLWWVHGVAAGGHKGRMTTGAFTGTFPAALWLLLANKQLILSPGQGSRRLMLTSCSAC